MLIVSTVPLLILPRFASLTPHQTFRTFEADKKHGLRRQATIATNDTSPSQCKRPRVQELPKKVVNAPSVILIPDSRSSSPYQEESGDDADVDDECSSDEDGSCSACSWGARGGLHLLK